MSIRYKLNQALEQYRKVILIASSFEYSRETVEILGKYEDVHVYISLRTEIKYGNIEEITSEQEKELLDLYYLYEFSDKFAVIDDNGRYGSVWNYMRTGLLTFEEAVMACIG